MFTIKEVWNQVCSQGNHFAKCLCIEIFDNIFIGYYERQLKTKKSSLLFVDICFRSRDMSFQSVGNLDKMRKENLAFCAPLIKIMTLQLGFAFIFLCSLSFCIFSQDFQDFESSYLWNGNRYQQTVKSFLFGFQPSFILASKNYQKFRSIGTFLKMHQ